MPYGDLPGPSTALNIVDELCDSIDETSYKDRKNKEKSSRKLSRNSAPFVGFANECSRDTEKDSLNDEQGVISDSQDGGKFSMTPSPRLRSSKKLLGLLTQNRSHLFLSSYPFYHLWIHLSSLYGIMLLIIMFAISLTEITDNSVKMFTLQGLYMMYLYVGSIAVIICIYIWVLVDSCSSIKSLKSDSSALAEAAELTRFGSLKKAHISPTKTSNTSFYLRIGALAFGLGTLVFSGLEMAMQSMMDSSCLTSIAFIHPILHALFTFLQMHFLFVNSQVLVEKFGFVARFGFMHLAATNIALWIKLIVIETGLEWIYFIYLAQSNVVPSNLAAGFDSDVPTPLQLRGFPRFISHQFDDIPAYGYNLSLNIDTGELTSNSYRPVSNAHIKQVVALHYCVNSNSLGQLWTSSMPFLYPFIIQFSLIAAGVTYVMGQNVGADRLKKQQQLSYSGRKFGAHNGANDANNNKKNCNANCSKLDSFTADERVDCNGISKGLFLGLLCLVVLTVIIIIFLVVKDDKDFPSHILSMLTFTILFVILFVCVILNSVGLYQIRKMSYSGKKMSKLDTLLNSVSTTGIFLYSFFSIVVGGNGALLSNWQTDEQHSHLMLFVIGILQILQCSIQSTFLGEAFQRQCLTRHQQLTKPGRQIITFLLCANVGLWAYDTFLTESWVNQEAQLQFYGLLTWGVISRISIPLCIFYRFHSTILLLEVWRRCYSSKQKEVR